MVLISIASLYLSVLPFCWGVKPSTKFSKRRGMTGSQFSDLWISEGGCWEKDREEFFFSEAGGGLVSHN